MHESFLTFAQRIILNVRDRTRVNCTPDYFLIPVLSVLPMNCILFANILIHSKGGALEVGKKERWIAEEQQLGVSVINVFSCRL